MKSKLTVSLLAILTASAFADTWPSGPIKLVVPFTPGGITDDIARSVGDRLSAELKVPVIYDYKPGASGTIGANYVAKSKPDGHTLLVATSSLATSAPTSFEPYNPLADFTPVSLLTKSPIVIVVNKDLPVKSFDQFVALAKEHPKKINYATSGVGSITHLTMIKAEQGGDFKITHIPYKGQSDAWKDFLAGQLDAVIDTPAGITKYLNYKSVRILAVTSRDRLVSMPDTPTVSESILKDFSAYGGFLIMAPKYTPKEIVNKLSAKLSTIVNSSKFKDKFELNGMISVGSTPEKAKEFINDEYNTWQAVIAKFH